MAPLPQNNTDRYFFDYTTGTSATSQEHTVVVRVTDSYEGPPEGTIEEGVQSAFLSVLNIIGPSQFRAGWKVTRVRLALKGEDFSFPLAVIQSLRDFVGGYTPSYLPRQEALQWTFVGRSRFTGRKAYLQLYTAAQDVETTFRVEGGTTGFPLVVRNVVSRLNLLQADGLFTSVGGTGDVIWYDYANQNYNSHWETKLRR